MSYAAYHSYHFTVHSIPMLHSMMSVKIVLAHLLRQFKFTTDLRFNELKLFLHIVLDIANENSLWIQEREFKKKLNVKLNEMHNV